MDIQNSPSAQAVALQMIPATNHRGRDAEIVGYGFNRVPLANLVGGCPARIARHFVRRMLAWGNRNNQFAFGAEFLIPVEIIRLHDRSGGWCEKRAQPKPKCPPERPCDSATTPACPAEWR